MDQSKFYRSVLQQPVVLDTICQDLSFEELLQLRNVLGKVEMNCPIPVEDFDDHLQKLPKLSDLTLKLRTQIKEDGSDFIYNQAKKKNDQEVLNILKQAGYDPSLISQITSLIKHDYLGDLFYTRMYNVFARIGRTLELIGDEFVDQNYFKNTRYDQPFDLIRPRFSSHEYESWIGGLESIFEENQPDEDEIDLLTHIDLDITVDLSETTLEEAQAVLNYFFPTLVYQTIAPDHIRMSLRTLSQAESEFQPFSD